MDGRARDEIVIVGAGLVGSLLSIFLTRRGFACTVYERRGDLRSSALKAGRSINLVVTRRGTRALAHVGLDGAVAEMTVPVLGRMMHLAGGELAYQPYGRDETERNLSISRSELNRLLVERAADLGVRFRFESRVCGVDLERRTIRIDQGAGRSFERSAALIFGADGAGSAVRAELVRAAACEEAIEPLDHGYKELRIPASEAGAFRIEPQALHIWPRGEILLMALPNRDGSFTVTLYLPVAGPSSFDVIDTPEKVRRLFATRFPDAVPLIAELEDDYLRHPTGSLGTVRCHPWDHSGRVLLIGDAAHAIVPFFGQGMNCGFEDCVVLDGLIDEHGRKGWAKILPEFTRSRKPDAEAIADMALENFVEMREKVADARFLLRKQVEHVLEQEMPREYRSRYAMVSYSDLPYRLALGAGRVQQGILDRLCDGLDAVTELDLDTAKRLVRERLTPYLRSHAPRG